ncbi:DUF2642 domain-containing protein [Bacillus sp. FSL K6-3431]|uniref:DUF2642 domain-containing protein n=1 Tax=Bacillus sp. FSL K6-3431 TaxID=2921500 RepID=UPI0030F6900B
MSGESYFQGVLTDFGQDVLVLFNGQQYIYIPLLHVHRINLNTDMKNYVDNPSEYSLAEETESLSYRKILTNAKGIFTEIYVTRNLTFHGYVTNVLSNYLAFYSPVYKLIFIPLEHLKWLTPYNQSTTPYTLSNEKLPVNSSNVPLLRSFEEQLKKAEGKLVVFDAGLDPSKIGLLKMVENNFAELANASGETVYLKLNHIKSVQLP